MGDQDTKSSLLTSMPGILAGAAALITAISGLAIWQHKQPRRVPNPRPAIVEPEHSNRGTEPAGERSRSVANGGGGQEAQVNTGVAKRTVTETAHNTGEPGSRPWCDQEVAEWSTKMAQGTDDAGIRKAFRDNKCGQQYGLRLGQPQAKQ